MILVDASRLHEGSQEQDFFTMKLLSYLSELEENPGQGWRVRPVALVLTKADECPDCLDDPNAFAREHAAGLWQQCQERFPHHQFFAASVAGTCGVRETRREGRQCVPLRIEPQGIIEPFEWLINQIRNPKRSNRRKLS